MKNIFTDHPRSIGESYFQHFIFASHFGLRMMFAGMACLIHAIFPFLFEKTGSNTLLSMTQHFVKRMPVVEDRVAEISRIIETKIETKKSA